MQLIACAVCGTERLVQRGRLYCSRECGHVAQRGRPRPHTPEWEANRLAAVREAAKNKVYPTGWTHSDSAKEKMSSAVKRRFARDDGRLREKSIGNLPKNCKGEMNGNWKGGKTAAKRDFATANSSKIKKWRATVLERDGYKCKDCGSTERLEVHHIIPIVQSYEFAFHRANGVALCKQCHKKTDSYAGKGMGMSPVGNLANIITIPHRWQDYDTCGNWMVGNSGTIAILVSEMGNEKYEMLVGYHELIEALLCKSDGVTAEEVDAFDMEFEATRRDGDAGEPGDDPRAPYHRQHQFATKLEAMLAAELGVDWDEYANAIEAL